MVATPKKNSKSQIKGMGALGYNFKWYGHGRPSLRTCHLNKDLKLRRGKATWLLCREHVKERKYDKGTETGASNKCWRNSKEVSVAGTERARGQP